MSNFLAAHLDLPDAYGNLHNDIQDSEVQHIVDELKENTSINDKQGFDGFQPPFVTSLVGMCLFAPLFSNSENELEVLKYAIFVGTNSPLITPTGLYNFMSIIGSGSIATQLVGTKNSGVIADTVKVNNLLASGRVKPLTLPVSLLSAYKAIGSPQHLGDDSVDHLSNRGVSTFENDYRRFGYILHLQKSMIAKHSLEFLRMNTSGS